MPAYHALLSRRRLVTLCGWVALAPLVASACRGDDDPTVTAPPATASDLPNPGPPTPSFAASSTPSASPSAQPTDNGTDPEALPPPVQLALEVAAREHDVPLKSVTLVSFSERDWPSPALGCPEEGRLYPQIVTPGYLVVVSVQAVQREYHTDSRMGITSC